MKNSGLSLTDILGMQTCILINSIASVVAIKHLQKNAGELTNLNERLMEINHWFGLGNTEMRRIAARIIRSMLFQIFLG